MKLKTISKIVILIALVTPIAQARCPMELCRGDHVVSDGGWEGEVLGINPHKRDVSVRWYRSDSGHSRNSRGTYSLRELYVKNTCLGLYCVGEDVVSDGGWEGEIIGVNKSKKKVAVRWYRSDQGHSRNTRTTTSKRNLALAKGCFNGLCVDDEVISPSGWEGVVLALNRQKNKAGIRWFRNSSGHSRNSRSTMNIEDLSISRYCLDFTDSQRYSDVTYDRAEPTQPNIPAQYYTVKSGETLLEIAFKFGLSLKEIAELNIDIVGDLDHIRVGLKIRIK